MYILLVAGREEKFLPYFSRQKQATLDTSNTEERINIVFEDATLAPKEESCKENVIKEENHGDFSAANQEKSSPKIMFEAFLKDFGFKKVSAKDALRTLVLAVCMIVIGSGVSFVWQTVLSLVGYTRIPSDTDYSSVGVLFKELFLVAVLPGLFEEFSHRGLLCAGYKKTGWQFVILSALLFSLMHQNIVQTGYTFVDGVAMALVMYYTGSIFPSIFMHFLNNAWSVFLGYVAQNGGAFNFINIASDWLYSSLVGLIILIIVFFACAIIAVLTLIFMRKEAVKCGRVSDVPFAKTQALPLYKDLMFWLTVVVGVVATVFSLVWGILR